MSPTFWNTDDHRVAVSSQEDRQGPILGYLILQHDGSWTIEGDDSGAVYQTRDAACVELLRAHLGDPAVDGWTE